MQNVPFSGLPGSAAAVAALHGQQSLAGRVMYQPFVQYPSQNILMPPLSVNLSLPGGQRSHLPMAELQQLHASFQPVGWYRYRCVRCNCSVSGYITDLQCHLEECTGRAAASAAATLATHTSASTTTTVAAPTPAAAAVPTASVVPPRKRKASVVNASAGPSSSTPAMTPATAAADVAGAAGLRAMSADGRSVSPPEDSDASAYRANPKKRRLHQWRKASRDDTGSGSDDAASSTGAPEGVSAAASAAAAAVVSRARDGGVAALGKPLSPLAVRRATNQDILEFFKVNMKTDRAHCVFCNKEVALDSYSAARPRGGKAKRHLAACTRCPPDLRAMLDEQAVREFHATKSRRRGAVWQQFTVVGYRRFRCHACEREIKGDAQCLKGGSGCPCGRAAGSWTAPQPRCAQATSAGAPPSRPTAGAVPNPSRRAGDGRVLATQPRRRPWLRAAAPRRAVARAGVDPRRPRAAARRLRSRQPPPPAVARGRRLGVWSMPATWPAPAVLWTTMRRRLPGAPACRRCVTAMAAERARPGRVAERASSAAARWL